MKQYFLIIISIIFITSCQNNDAMKIAFTGDVILDRGVNDEIKLHGDTILINTLKKIKKNDFFIINYEGTFTKLDIKQSDLYNFKADKNKVVLLKKGGVTHISIANNHIFDYGKKGFEDTLNAIKEQKLTTLGETCTPKILIKNNYKCAILSASLTTFNDSLCISSITQLKNSIKLFNTKNKNIPLVLYIHWGLELQPKPENWQRKLAKDLVNLGVDAIIGHHPHITQTIEFINNKPIFYSIGNYIADGYLPNTKSSYTVELTITDTIKDIKIIPILINNYFPKIIKSKEQFTSIKKHLSYSEGICAFQTTNSWTVTPTQNINFKENSKLWLFAEKNFTTAIKKLKSGSHLLKTYYLNNASNSINLHGKLSEIQISDINNDGNSDILLGISKKVNFDSIFKKRINIYSCQNLSIKPLWLGTKFINDVENFDVINNNNFNYLTTTEINNKGNRFQRTYEWDDFGFALTKIENHEN